jgi:hypothetical protein
VQRWLALHGRLTGSLAERNLFHRINMKNTS